MIYVSRDTSRIDDEDAEQEERRRTEPRLGWHPPTNEGIGGHAFHDGNWKGGRSQEIQSEPGSAVCVPGRTRHHGR